MSIAGYPWESTAQIRAHYAEKRSECHARYERESIRINQEEQEMLTEHRKLLAIMHGPSQDAQDLSPC